MTSVQTLPIIVAVDAQYEDTSQTGRVAAVVFEGWQAEQTLSEYQLELSDVAAYTPGSFYKRELPAIEAILQEIQESFDVLIVDGYVDLERQPDGTRHRGLGRYVFESYVFERCGDDAIVVGVAKNAYYGAAPVEVLRGESTKALYITAAGIDAEEAAKNVQRMAGEFRFPDLLRRVDQLARGL